MTPEFMPSKSSFANREHGTRLRYLSGCKCVPCRAANSRYQSERYRLIAMGQGNGLVDAAPARCHVRRLSAKGMGYKAVARAAKVSISVMAKIRTGQRQQIRAESSRRILAVTLALAPHALVPAGPTWQRVNRLIADGWPKARIAKFLGAKSPALQLRPHFVTRKNEQRIARLYRWLNAEVRTA